MTVEEPKGEGAASAGKAAAREQERIDREERRRNRRVIVPQLRRNVDAELAGVRETVRLLNGDRIGVAGYIALLLAIAVNVWGYAAYGDRYMLMWMVASLYFYCFYWLLPMVSVPLQGLLSRKRPPGEKPAKPVPKQLIREVKEANLLRFRNRLIAVGWNVWFLGAVSMTAGYLFIFSMDILYAILAGFVFRWLAILTVTLVIVQSVGIILYYLVVFFLRPYSSDFFAWLAVQMKGRQERRAQGRSSFGPTMVLAGISFVIVVLLVVAILFPGHTLDRILPVEQLRADRFHLYLLLILASQLMVMQVLHRWLSRLIAKPVLAASEKGLAREARALRFLSRRRSPGRRLRRIDRAASLLAETRLYRVKAVRPIGLYTLFLLGSDYLAVLALRDVRRMDSQLRLPGRSRRKRGVTGIRAAEPLSAGRL